MKSESTPIYQIKITLLRSEPPIWRSILVRSDIKLSRLHKIFQATMGWHDYHMHQFVTDHERYGWPDPEYFDPEASTLNEKHYTLAHIASAEESRFIYEYDFGDCWQHEVVIEKILPADDLFKRPFCVGGANACPPEDCGGMTGYSDFLRILANPDDEEHEEMKEWLGVEFDSTLFDLRHVNALLRQLKS